MGYGDIAELDSVHIPQYRSYIGSQNAVRFIFSLLMRHQLSRISFSTAYSTSVQGAHATGSGSALTAGASHSHSYAYGHPTSAKDWPVLLLQRSVDWCQQYITVRLYEGTFSDIERRGVTVNDIAGPVKWLGKSCACVRSLRLILSMSYSPKPCSLCC